MTITRRKKPAGILSTSTPHAARRERERFVAAVEEGLEDAASGRTIDDDRLTARLDARFGPLRD